MTLHRPGLRARAMHLLWQERAPSFATEPPSEYLAKAAFLELEYSAHGASLEGQPWQNRTTDVQSSGVGVVSISGTAVVVPPGDEGSTAATTMPSLPNVSSALAYLASKATSTPVCTSVNSTEVPSVKATLMSSASASASASAPAPGPALAKTCTATAMPAPDAKLGAAWAAGTLADPLQSPIAQSNATSAAMDAEDTDLAPTVSAAVLAVPGMVTGTMRESFSAAAGTRIGAEAATLPSAVVVPDLKGSEGLEGATPDSAATNDVPATSSRAARAESLDESNEQPYGAPEGQVAEGEGGKGALRRGKWTIEEER